MNHMKILTALILLLLVLCFVWMAACQSNRTQNPDALEVAGPSNRHSSVLLPPGEPGSPYAKSYDPEIDGWIFENLVYIGKRGDYELSCPEGQYLMETYADDEGYQVPFATFVRQKEAAIKNGKRDSFNSMLEQNTALIAVGEMEEPLISAVRDKQWNIRSEFFMPVPSWLIQNPPTAAMLLPNGDVATKGPVADADPSGLPDPDPDPCCGGNGDYMKGYFLYSPDGELLSFDQDSFFGLYYKEELSGDLNCAVQETRPDGYTILRGNSHEVLAVYDYDGTKLQSLDLPPTRDTHPFMLLPTRTLCDIYEAQQRIQK